MYSRSKLLDHLRLGLLEGQVDVDGPAAASARLARRSASSSSSRVAVATGRRRARSTLRSSRTLPGQLWRRRRSSSSGVDRERAAAANCRDEVLDQQRDVVGALAQRRHAACAPRPAGSRDPRGSGLAATSARRLRLVAATTRTATLLRSRSPPTRAHRAACRARAAARLQLGRQLADLVEEQRAAVGLARRRRARSATAPGEGAAHVAEQRRLDQLARHRAAVEHDERAVAARRCGGGSPRRTAPCRCRSRPRSAPSRRSARRRPAARNSLRSLGSRPSERAEGLLVGGRQLERLFVGDVLEDGLADRHLGAEAQRQLLEARALDERAVGRAEIAHHDALRPALDLEVPARDRRIGEQHVAAGARADGRGRAARVIDSPRSGPLTTSSRPDPTGEKSLRRRRGCGWRSFRSFGGAGSFASPSSAATSFWVT